MTAAKPTKNPLTYQNLKYSLKNKYYTKGKIKHIIIDYLKNYN